MMKLCAAPAAALALFAMMSASANAQGPAEAEQCQNLLTPILTSSETIIGQAIGYPIAEPAKIVAAIVTMPPGGETGWHLYEVPLFAYIIAGEVTVDYGVKGSRVYGVGDGFLEAIEWSHNGVNMGSEPVSILAVYMGAEWLENTIATAGPDDSADLGSANHHVVAGDDVAGRIDDSSEPLKQGGVLGHPGDQRLGQVRVGVDETRENDPVLVPDQLSIWVGGPQLGGVADRRDCPVGADQDRPVTNQLPIGRHCQHPGAADERLPDAHDLTERRLVRTACEPAKARRAREARKVTGAASQT